MDSSMSYVNMFLPKDSVNSLLVVVVYNDQSRQIPAHWSPFHKDFLLLLEEIPTPVNMVSIPLLTGFYTFQVVQDLFQQ